MVSKALMVVCAGVVAACSQSSHSPSSATEAYVDAGALEIAPTKIASPRVAFDSATPAGSLVLARVHDKPYAIIADEDAHALTLLRTDLNAGDVTTIGLSGEPARVAVGRHLYATLRDRSRVVAYDLHEDGSSEKVAEAVTASEPFGLAVSPDGETVYVTTAFGHTFEAFTADALKPLFSRQIASEPRGITLSADGARAFVAHATGSTLDVVDLLTKDAREISLDVKEGRIDFGVPAGLWSLPDGANNDRSKNAPMNITFPRTAELAVDAVMIGDEVLVPETLVLPGDTIEPATGYGDSGSGLRTHVAHVAHIDSKTEKLTTTFISGAQNHACFELDRAPSCTLPRASAALGHSVYITCDGTGLLIEHRLAEPYDQAPKCFGARAKQRKIKVGSGPRGLAIDPASKHAFVWTMFDRKLTEIDLGGEAMRSIGSKEITLPAGATVLADDVREGRELFFDNTDLRVSNDGRACASCHPGGRQDGLVWTTPKGKRQTPMLAGRVKDTAPYDWNGKNATLETHIAQTTRNLHGTGLDEKSRTNLAAYLTSLSGPDRESTREISEDSHVRSGQAIFESSEAQCSSCHPHETAFTDHSMHAFVARGEAFDTPSLRFVGGTAPYFHDGRYLSLEDLVEKCDGIMGSTKQLSVEQKKDLVAYVRTL